MASFGLPSFRAALFDNARWLVRTWKHRLPLKSHLDNMVTMLKFIPELGKPLGEVMDYNIDAPHMPVGLPDHLKGDFEDILRRIPDGWGRWISCDPGWFPMIAELHRTLVDMDPNYEVHQVKEKFGGLRYYYGPGNAEMDAVVRQFENRSYKTCELCGDDARMCRKGYWYKTLCSNCAAELKYEEKNVDH